MLKRFLLTSILLISFFGPKPTLAQFEEEVIRNFESEIVVNKDATTKVKEKITYHFSDPRHGIVWRIPYTYSVKAFRRPTKIDINNVSYYSSRTPNNVIENKYSKSTTNGWLELKIGDENTQVVGEYIFEIEYTMTYTGISYFEDHEEVYLNVIGPGWDVPINQASLKLTVPESITGATCYTGPDRATQSDCKIISTSGRSLSINTTQRLEAYEGFTFAVSMPVGTFDDTTKQQAKEFIIANIGVLLPIPVGIFFFLLVKRKGKNEKLTVIPNYVAEKEWNALRSGYIYTTNRNNKHVTALLIDLAVKGYLTIKQIGNNKYELSKTTKSSEDLPSYIKTIYEAVFTDGDTIPLSKLSSSFPLKVNQSFNELDKLLKQEQVLSSSRVNLKNALLISSILIGISIFSFGIAFLIQYAALGWVLGIFISALIMLIASLKIDVRSPDLGNKEYHDLLGLRMYIDTAEKHRIEFHNDPKKFNQIFEKLLPYAMIFGLEKKWAKEFEDIYTQAPDWYQGDFTTFNAYNLSRSLGSFNTALAAKSIANNSYSSAGGYRSGGGWSSGSSGFGGGGFSGGGGGGSGGGSW